MYMCTTKDEIKKIEKLIKEKTPGESRVLVIDEIEKYAKSHKTDVRDIIVDILAYEKGMQQSTGPKNDIVIAFSIITLVVSMFFSYVIQNKIMDELLKFAVMQYLIYGMCAAAIILCMIAIIKINMCYKREALIQILENYRCNKKSHKNKKK